MPQQTVPVQYIDDVIEHVSLDCDLIGTSELLSVSI